MKNSELVDFGAKPTEALSFLKDSENVSATLRMPRSLRDSAKEAVSLSGMSLASYIKMCLIGRLSGVDCK